MNGMAYMAVGMLAPRPVQKEIKYADQPRPTAAAASRYCASTRTKARRLRLRGGSRMAPERAARTSNTSKMRFQPTIQATNSPRMQYAYRYADPMQRSPLGVVASAGEHCTSRRGPQHWPRRTCHGHARGKLRVAQAGQHTRRACHQVRNHHLQWNRKTSETGRLLSRKRAKTAAWMYERRTYRGARHFLGGHARQHKDTGADNGGHACTGHRR